MKRAVLVTAVVAFFASGIPAARATYTIYDNRAAFLAATVNPQTIDFEGLAGSPGALYVDGSGLYQKGATFTGPIPGDYWLFVIEPWVTPEFYDWGSGAVLLGPSSGFGDGSIIAVSLPSNTTAFGTDLMSILPYAAGMTLTLSTGDTFTVPTSDYPDRSFFGITADASIASVSFTAEDGAFPLLDNFTIAQATPLPPSLVLFGIGGAALVGYRWRRGGRGTDARP